MTKEIIQPAFSRVPHNQWLSLNSDQQRYLERWTGECGQWQKLATEHTFPFGYYQCADAKCAIFVKIITPEHAKKTVMADSIVQYLRTKISSVIPLISTDAIPIKFDDTVASLLVYPLIKSRYIATTVEDYQLLGHELAVLHKTLAAYNESNQVKERSEQWMNSLLATGSRSNLEQLSHVLPKSALKYLLAIKASDFQILAFKPQVIHADINFGNVLFANGIGGRSQDTLYFIDFEDSQSTFASPLQDIAFAIERLILQPNKGDWQKLNKHVSAFLNGYRAVHPSLFIDEPENWLIEMLRAISYKSLLQLTQFVKNSGALVLPEEWQKFVDHLNFIESNEQRINQLVNN
ncbi:phosphotransferase [Thalassotalea fusca]